MSNNKLKICIIWIILLFLYPNIILCGNIDSLKQVFIQGASDQKLSAAISVSNYYFYSEPDSSEYYLKEALQISKSNKDNKKIGTIYINLGILYNEKGLTSTAEKYFNDALIIAEAEKDSSIILASLGNLGNSAMYNGDYVNALSYFVKILNLYKVQNNYIGMGNTYGAIGNIFFKTHKDDKALHYYDLSGKNFEFAKDTLSSAIVLLNEASIYAKQNKLDIAEKNYLIAYNIFIDNKKNLNAAQCLEGLSELYLVKKNYQKADNFIVQSLKIYRNLDAQKNIAGSFIMLGHNRFSQNKYQSAIVFYDSAYQISFQLKNYKQLSDETSGLQNCYYNLRDFKNAYKYSVLFKTYSDSLFNIKKAEKFSELEVKFETSQKEQQITLLTKENEISETKHERDKWIITMLLVIVVFTVSIFILLFNRQKLINNQKQLLIEQKLLRLQMNPHFIFNSLLAVQNFMFQNNAEKATYYLSNFAKLMRKILENSRKDYISITEELDILEHYVVFQKLRFKNAFDFIIEINDDIDKENILIPPMLIQPFVENSIEYAFTPKIDNPKIIVSLKKQKNIILVKIIDNGTGIKNNVQIENIDKKHKSLAVKITKDRLKNICSKKDRKNIIFTIENLSKNTNNLQGTVVQIGIPFKEEF